MRQPTAAPRRGGDQPCPDDENGHSERQKTGPHATSHTRPTHDTVTRRSPRHTDPATEQPRA